MKYEIIRKIDTRVSEKSSIHIYVTYESWFIVLFGPCNKDLRLHPVLQGIPRGTILRTINANVQLYCNCCPDQQPLKLQGS